MGLYRPAKLYGSIRIEPLRCSALQRVSIVVIAAVVRSSTLCRHLVFFMILTV